MSEHQEIALSCGRVRGRIRGDLVVLRGIPYAAAPVGERRFSPPAPAPTWAGVRDATSDGPIAPQAPSRVFASMGPIQAPQDEDCLTLTVWAPRERSAPLPVIVWLHGGGFQTGAGSLPWYDGAELAARGFVVVGVNYRLGPLGYLAIPGVVPGNLATLDQEAAIRWVAREAEALGGDPDSITLLGQSGGGHTIAALLLLERTRGLFRRAILQSPPLGISLYDPAEAAEAADAFLQILGLRRDDPALGERLRSLSPAELLAANAVATQGSGRMARGDLRPLLMPVCEAPLETDLERFAEAAGEAAANRGVDILIGWTRDETNLFVSSFPPPVSFGHAEVDAVARARLGPQADAMLAELRARRPGGRPVDLFSDLVTELVFRGPALALASAAASRGGRAFVYQFDWPSPRPGVGACHCIDLPFTFGTWEAWRGSPMLEGVREQEFRGLSRAVIDRWTAFARDGDPGFAAWQADAPVVLHLRGERTLEDA